MAVRLHGHVLTGLPAGAINSALLAAGAVNTAALAAGAVTGAKVATGPFTVLRFVGVAAAGPITLTGATVGMRVVALFGAPTAGGALAEASASFESTISVLNQIQQTSGSNLSANNYIVVLEPVAS